MKRKVIKQGNNTLTITLPRKWTENFGVKAGDEVELIESESKLIIDSKNTFKKSITLNLKDCSERMIKRILPGFHHSGYDEVTILYSRPSQVNAIHSLINVLAGYEIIEQKPTRCIIKSLSESEEMDIEKIMNRIFLILHSMILSLNEYSGKKGSNMKDLLALDLTLDRLTNYAERYINKSLPKNSVYLYLLVWNLECMGDYIRDICKNNISIKLNDKQKKIVLECADIIDNLRHTYFNFDIKEIDKIQQNCDKFLFNNSDENIVIRSMKNIIQRVHDLMGTITTLKYVTTDEKQNI
jgi:phosphate uptake regulator